MMQLTPEQLDKVLEGLSPEEMAAMLAMMQELDERKRVALAQMDFLSFIAVLDAQYKFGTHLKKLGALLMDVETGAKNRVAVSMAPRFGKSQMISIYYPAWYLGKHPDHQVIMASHTADLAVDMARKVRNIMQTAEYRAIFPGVAIAADAKAAGKWNTTKGGTVFATGVGGAIAGRGAHLCCAKTTLVHTLERGIVTADTVQIGDHLRSWHGWAQVAKKIQPEHQNTYHIAGRLLVSAGHPIWTCNRGWVNAEHIKPSDILWSMTLFDTINTHLHRSVYGARKTWTDFNTYIQHMGDDVATLHKPKSSQLCRLWRSWGDCVPRVAGFFRVLFGYGASSYDQAYLGQEGQQPRVFARELSVVRPVCAAKQPNQRGALPVSGASDVRTPVSQRVWANATSNAASVNRHGTNSRGGNADAEGEPQLTGYTAVRLGWLRAAAVRVLGRCSQKSGRGIQHGEERVMGSACAQEWARAVCGLLLGVRFAGNTKVEAHTPREFVNFEVAGDHTFVGNGILSHNCIVDDPHSEQDIKNGNTANFDVVYEWFRSGLRTRLMPGGAICVLHTRWSQRDLVGRLTKDAILTPDGDQYEVFEFPAILEQDNPIADPDNPEFDPDAPKVLQKSLWPEQWTLESLLRTKASMPAWQWNAQYQQNPTAQESAIIKASDIKWWSKERPPKIDFIVQAFDTALTTNTRSDYSVCLTLGVWRNDDGVDNVIMLNCAKGKWEFPELKKMALQQAKDWEPDSIIVEAKASGQPLIDEMRRSGLFVQDYSPGKGQDKMARLNAVSDMFVSGQVWFPETAWASDMVEEILAFPSGLHDDQVDCVTLGLIRIRKGGLLQLSSDNIPDDTRFQNRKGYY